MLEITKQQIISIAVLNEDVEIFQSLFEKLQILSTKPGYKKEFTKEETKLIDQIDKEINE